MRSKFVIICYLAIALSGCANKTPGVSTAEVEMARRYETAIKNDDAIYEKTATANQINFERRKDLELKADLRALDVDVKLNPAKWAVGPDGRDVVREEIDRKRKLHDDAIEAYRQSQANNYALREKNRSVNVGGARAIGNALNPPKSPPPILDQSDMIEAAPKPAPLIQP